GFPSCARIAGPARRPGNPGLRARTSPTCSSLSITSPPGTCMALWFRGPTATRLKPMNRLGMTVPVAGETMGELPAVLDELAGAGYSDIWTSEVNATDALAPLLMAARQTPRLRLGTSIAGVFSRSPALMAMSALAVAELSDEPIYVGVGSSSQNMVEQWHGTPFVQPYQRVRDTVRFLRAAFAGDRVTFHGDSFEIDGFRLARVPPRSPRILVAALREGMLRLGGQ